MTWYYVYFEADSETYGLVPEPATTLLFSVGAMGLGFSRCWNRR